MKYRHFCLCCFVSLFISVPLSNVRADDQEFHLLAYSFSSGGIPSTDGETTLLACIVGGLSMGNFQDETVSIRSGDLINLTEAGQPFLESVMNATELRFSWNATGTVLERTENLSPPITWTAVSGGDSGFVVLPLNDSHGFFRLRCDVASP